MDKQANIQLDFSSLVPYQPRRFVPADVDLTNREQVELLWRQLLDRPIQSSDELEIWVLDRSELEAAVAQQQSVLYIRMTCQTDDPQRTQAYTDFVKTIEPVIKCLSDELDRKMIHTADALSFNPSRYAMYFRRTRSDMELFRAENVPLQTEDSLLSQQYQQITGAMTVQFRGQELPLSQMRKYVLETDRSTREQAWKAFLDRYQQDKEPLDNIFDKMISVRQKIAEHAGFENYRDYKFREYHRFDYTPQHCRQYHDAVEKYIVPLQRQIYQLRAEQMNLLLRPWDLQCDPLGRGPLKPADNLNQLTEGLCTMFGRVDAAFGSQFQMMLDEGLLDLESRKGKAPGGYQETLHEARKPFIFGNTNGTDDDLNLLTHEGGHAFHLLACTHEKLTAYLHAPIEFCEVASMSMEFLSAAHLDVFYRPDERKRWWRDKFEDCVRALIVVAIFDAFQHWIYENPSHTVEQRQQQWIELNRRYGTGIEDWSGLEEYRASQWHRVLHFFQFPFYFIEYGIAQLGALGVWMQAKQDTAKAVENYKKALSLGGSRPLPELFSAAGLEFDFSEKTIRPLSRILLSEWQKQLQD